MAWQTVCFPYAEWRLVSRLCRRPIGLPHRSSMVRGVRGQGASPARV